MGKPVLIYMGTPEFAVPPLEALCRSDLAPALVYTQPDRPRGRGRKLGPPPVAEAARRLGLEVRQPEILQTKTERLKLEELGPDLILTVAYGKILRPRWLALPRLGAVNLHPSLLPRYRGMNPVARALLEGDSWTGMTTFQLDEGTDTGPILIQEATPIGPEETFGELSQRLSDMGGEILLRTVRGLCDGSIQGTPQEHELASVAPPFAPEERGLNWRRPALQVHNLVRALSPAPGAEATCLGQRLKILRVRPVDEVTMPDLPGRLLKAGKNPPLVGCWPGQVELLEVRPQGKPTMSGAAWARGLKADPRTLVLESGA